MALKIQNAPQSFIRFGAEVSSDCYSCAPDFCLLMAANDVFAFQFKITGSNAELDGFTSGGGFDVTTLLEDVNGATSIIANTYYWLYSRSNDGESYIIVRCNVVIPSGLIPDKKYRIILRVEKGSTLIEELSNCITYIVETCYSALLRYRNNEDAFGFIYCLGSDYINTVRLPFHLVKPQFTDEEEVYFRSDGDAIMLSSINRKEYSLVTDYMPEWAHESLKLALSHDFVEITSEDYTGEIRKSGNYEISWIEFIGVKSGTASVSVNAIPFDEKNTACEDCEDCEELLDLPQDIVYTYPGIISAGDTVLIDLRAALGITDMCGPIVNALSGFNFNGDYIESVVLIDEVLEIKVLGIIPDEIFLNEAISEIVLRCGCGIFTVASINLNFNQCSSIEYTLGAEKVLVNCDGDIAVGRDINVTGPTGATVTTTIQILNDGSIAGLNTFSGTVPYALSKDTFLAGADFGAGFDDSRLFYKIIFALDGCTTETEEIKLNKCQCPTEEYILELIEWEFSYHDEITRDYLSSVVVILLGNFFDTYPSINRVEIRAEGGAGTIIDGFSVGSDNYSTTYAELEEVGGNGVYFVLICCFETGDECETIIQLTP